MTYSTLSTYGKNRFTKSILQASFSFCLAFSFSIAQVDTAQAAFWTPGGDKTAPTVPSGLTASAASSSQINLTWKASTDSVGVKGYKVYRSGAMVATVSGTSYSNTGLSASTTYKYTVAAYDAAGNTSAQSGSVSSTTLASSGGGDGGGSGGGSGGGGGGGVAGVPAGIYSIDTVVDKPFVDGVLIRIYWSKIEPTEGKYDFSKLDKTIQQAEALGQSVSIATFAVAEPTWLQAKCQTFNDPTYGLSIVPWDQTMLTAFGKLVNALSVYKVDGVALKDHPAVKQVDAAIGGIQSIRLTQLPSGYTADKYESAVNTSVGYWANAFPNKQLYVGLFPVNDGASNPSTAERIRDGLLSKYSVNFFEETLSGSAPSGSMGDLLGDVQNQTGIMFQACGEWSNKGAWSWCNWLSNDSPSAGMSLGYNTFGAKYFEIYTKDLTNSSYATQFQQWHDTLQPYLP